VVLLRGGGQTTVTPVPAPTTTIPAPEETGPSSTPTTPSTTTPSTVGGSAFSLPAGTKLQRSEGDGEAAGDPALIRELQRALASAGFDPGPADGTFGKRTEAAVVAFQEANGLSVDGRVGPETASALNNAVADG
jgi:peptidoglycan hydrolase-like protein with peptidoglycan-binding domain